VSWCVRCSDPQVVFLQSPLTSAFRVGLGRTLPGDLFKSIDKVAKIQVRGFSPVCARMCSAH
jgi:hypothetical protein